MKSNGLTDTEKRKCVAVSITEQPTFPTSDLQKSRHLQKRRVTERHNRDTNRSLKPHQAQKKGRRFAPFLGRGARLQFALCAPIVPLCGATFSQMTRLLQVTRMMVALFLNNENRAGRS